MTTIVSARIGFVVRGSVLHHRSVISPPFPYVVIASWRRGAAAIYQNIAFECLEALLHLHTNC